MNIADKQITTPSDNPLGYALDWRAQVARAVFELPPGSVRPAIQDPDARALHCHLLRRQQFPLRTGAPLTAFDQVTGWRESPAKQLIEAFLVGAASYEEAAGDLGVPVKETTLYGRLFFDVRDEQGWVRPGTRMRLLGSMDPDDDRVRLLRIALTGGRNGLRGVLGAAVTTKESSLDELVEAELTRRLHAGELRTADLVRLQANSIARQRIAVEQQDDSEPPMLRAVKLVTDFLALTKPHMVEQTQTAEQVAVTNAAIQGHLRAQRSIAATPVADDPERGLAALTEMMGKHFKG